LYPVVLSLRAILLTICPERVQTIKNRPIEEIKVLFIEYKLFSEKI
jgi:hypothetical protein